MVVEGGENLKAYIAGPLFSQGELEFNEKVDACVREAGIDTFLPQRDGLRLSELLEQGIAEEKAKGMIFDLDVRKLKETDIVIMIYDGRVPDEGAACELGMAYAYGKHLIGLKTDVRTLIGGNDNPMQAVPLRSSGGIATSLPELSKILESHVAQKQGLQIRERKRN